MDRLARNNGHPCPARALAARISVSSAALSLALAVWAAATVLLGQF
jgi:hypothetical protein